MTASFANNVSGHLPSYSRSRLQHREHGKPKPRRLCVQRDRFGRGNSNTNYDSRNVWIHLYSLQVPPIAIKNSLMEVDSVLRVRLISSEGELETGQYFEGPHSLLEPEA